jgi:predicted phosphoadenosine phosphosulfate sulfurtransferase
MCKVLLRNDWWCKGLGLTQPLSEAYGQYMAIKKKRKDERALKEYSPIELIEK